MKISPTRIFVLMCIAFVMYSVIIYTIPLRDNSFSEQHRNNEANGKLVWQKYNCQACHQLYGLGGYLGPDLTNVVSRTDQGEAIIRSVVRSGTKQMPSFEMSEDEMNQLVAFLKDADTHGTSDPRSFIVTGYGTIESK